MARIGDGCRPHLCPRHFKLTFKTENEAKLQLLRASLRHAEEGRDKVEKRYFPCALGGFHLTSWTSEYER